METPLSPVGLWPLPAPFGEAERAFCCLDGSLAALTAATWAQRNRRLGGALVLRSAGRQRAAEAALAQAVLLGLSPHEVELPEPLCRPAGWALAHCSAQRAGASWLVLGLTREEPDLALRLAAADSTVRAWGFGGLWAPLLGWNAVEVARLALALGVVHQTTWECLEESPCGACPGCARERASYQQLGLPPRSS